MMFGLTQTVAPASEPVSLTEAKAHLRVEVTDDDTLISSLIIAARGYAEKVAKRQLVTATWQYVADWFPTAAWIYHRTRRAGPFDFRQWYGEANTIIVPKPPLQSVTSITYLNAANVLTTMPTTDYTVDTVQQPGRVRPTLGKAWPVTYNTSNAVVMTYVAGYGAAAAVPQMIKQAMLMLILHWYFNRGDEVVTVPPAVDILLRMHWSGEMYG